MCVCFSIPTLDIRYAKRIFYALYYLITCGLSGRTNSFHIILKKTKYSEKKFIENEMCVLIFSARLVCNISHSKKSSGFMVINVCSSVCKFPVILVKLQ